MTIRLFKCPDCGHKMRIQGKACGMCYSQKPLPKRIGVWLTLGASLLVFVPLAVVAATH